MRNLQDYGLWLVLVTINAVIVSQWVNYLIVRSGEGAGLAAGLFLSIFLASLMFVVIRGVISRLDRQRCDGKLQAANALKAVGVI